MRLTYRTLAALIEKMSDDQKDSDLTVEIRDDKCSECFHAELRIAGEEHDSLDDGHPVVYVCIIGFDESERRNDIDVIASDIGLNQ